MLLGELVSRFRWSVQRFLAQKQVFSVANLCIEPDFRPDLS